MMVVRADETGWLKVELRNEQGRAVALVDRAGLLPGQRIEVVVVNGSAEDDASATEMLGGGDA